MNVTTKKYQIDGRRFSTLEQFYDEVSARLIPGAEWGKNLDAFIDILRGGFGTPESGFVLLWVNSDVSRKALGYAETIRQLEIRLAKCHSTGIAKVAQDLREALNHRGPTVFDWLIEIISKNKEIELILD